MPTTRFSDRAQLYAKYRPGYPAAVIEVLKGASLSSTSVVADVGSGTGISTRLFAPHVSRVFAVEPNAEMRAESERALPANVVSINGTAESTTLAFASVDFVVAATAFHWFDKDSCRAEFHRILKPGAGLVVLMWNMRKAQSSPLVQAYEGLLEEFGTDYQPSLMSQNWNAPAEEFYGLGMFDSRTLPNHQEFDFEGFKGRLLSASYAPLPGHQKYEPMIARLREIYERNQVGGLVRFEYDTHLYWGLV